MNPDPREGRANLIVRALQAIRRLVVGTIGAERPQFRQFTLDSQEAASDAVERVESIS